ncbi:hypothetical protein F4604DRAFT_664949 [Suillus subluteus]|nr:hypothetical protein F4604DRAFT_664949 [Suillus subluteus]
MTTESCMISAISSIIYLVLYAMDNFVQYPFMAIQNQMQVRDNTTSCHLDLILINAGRCTICIDLENHPGKSMDMTHRMLISRTFLPAPAGIVLVLVFLRHSPLCSLTEFHIINK